MFGPRGEARKWGRPGVARGVTGAARAARSPSSRSFPARERVSCRAMLNWIWAAFFLVAFVTAIVQAVVFGRVDVFRDVTASLFSSAKTGFEISIGLTGIMALWLGLMRIGEKGGVVEGIAKAVGPLFRRLFPGIPPGHPASGAIVMNLS